jgi:hypothetical protein
MLGAVPELEVKGGGVDVSEVVDRGRPGVQVVSPAPVAARSRTAAAESIADDA